MPNKSKICPKANGRLDLQLRKYCSEGLS